MQFNEKKFSEFKKKKKEKKKTETNFFRLREQIFSQPFKKKMIHLCKYPHYHVDLISSHDMFLVYMIHSRPHRDFPLTPHKSIKIQ